MKLLTRSQYKLQLFLLSVSTLTFSCNNTGSNDEQSGNRKTVTDSLTIKTKLIDATINLPALQEYLAGQETMKQKEIVILKNERVRSIERIGKFNKKIKLLTDSEIRNFGVKAVLDYKSIVIRNDSAFIYYRYDIQGIGIKSIYFYKKHDWYLIKYDLWEN
jgi:hypothetical protein